jgi:hypothetical protein
MDVVLVVSACPMDIVPTNGSDLRPKALAVRKAGSPRLPRTMKAL